MNPLLAQFLSESREQLEMTSAALLAMESQPDDRTKLGEIFRAIHTIKGSSGLFEVPPITRLIHAAEDLLDALREDQVSLESAMVDLLLDSFDQVNQWLDELELQGSLAAHHLETATASAGKLRAFLPAALDGLGHPVAAADPLDTTATDLSWLGDFVDWMGELAEQTRAECYDRWHRQALPITAFCYTPDAQCFFSGEDPFYLVRQTPALAFLAVKPTRPWPQDLTEWDVYECVLRFQGITSAPIADVRTLFRYVLPQTALVTVEPEVLAIPTGARDGVIRTELVASALTWVEQENHQALVQFADTQLTSLNRPNSWFASALRWLRRLLGRIPPQWRAIRYLLGSMSHERTPNWRDFTVELAQLPAPPPAALPSPPRALPAPNSVAAPPTAVSAEDLAAFNHIAAAQRRLLDIPIEAASWTGRVGSLVTALSAALAYVGREDEIADLQAAQQQALDRQDGAALKALIDSWSSAAAGAGSEATGEAPSSPTLGPTSLPTASLPPEEAPTASHPTTVLKIDQQRVDTLMDLIGELVVAKNGLPYLAQRAERQYGSRELAREIKEQYGVINRIAQELQASIMQVRMMPVGQVFQRFPRLVRDLSKKLDKQIQLVIVGEDTEADKNIIEGLADPLIHILRNSIDHGLEPPEERLSAGKSPIGTIRLHAYRDNDSVALEISDDGRGVHVEAVKAKAVRQGLISDEQAAAMSDQEAVQLIFAAGLSTAAQVSDVSGRGVGMDVVRSSLERVGGSVTVHSERGVGTHIRLLLPLSMAVTQVMAVELDGKPLGVPMEAVVETVRLLPTRIFTLKQREVFLLREQLVPLIRLRRLFALEEMADDPRCALAVLVVKLGNDPVGLVVDNFREGMEVILKPLEGVLAGLRHYAGTALLGDGSVMLVLNLRELN